jgi:glucan phosphoethanolaminetransferase (alkaline phosphatase superfamily)
MRRTMHGGIIGRPSRTLEINMLKPMAEYFTAEKQESLWFLAVALLALVVAVRLWINGHRLKSMAFPLVAVASGIGAGLLLQAAFMLAFDMFAEARGQDYLAALNAFSNTP